MSKALDSDIRALKGACRALEHSSSTRMLAANLNFLIDRYLAHPPVKAWWAKLGAMNPGRRPR